MHFLFKVGYVIISLLLFVYLIIPTPKNVINLLELANSLKSIEPGDTHQVPNIAAYYSNLYRNDVIDFYLAEFKKIHFLPFLPLRLNYPPEFAYTAIRDQTKSTYLEEIVYPMKTSLFINGYEPFYEDGDPKFPGATDIIVEGVKFNTKTTIRLYPSDELFRIIMWLLINFMFVLLIKTTKKVFSKDVI